ncbi:methylosome subunit pICln-like isoform X1 [Eriocheir sinensis]|uniref:methylosome subunit pICln-like isoform X1 n=1 Tax=Eriocheir sinensis TaxID=95602 RepID=UPI0021C63EE8|nr:methylosome subunit pICln-like isoform X1 [Eriocheir sinensis]
MLLLNLPAPEEGVKHRQENTRLVLHQETHGPGTLVIAESRVSWVKDGEEQHTLSLAYPHIAIHAVSRDTSNQNQPCLCLIIDTTINLPWVNTPVITNEAEDSDEEDEAGTACTELKFIPSDPMSLEPMYQALNVCQALHPDPQDQSDEDLWAEEDDEGIYDEGDYEVSENGYHSPYEDNMEAGVDGVPRVGSRTAPSHLEQNAEGEAEEAMETGQFDDADD